MNLIRSPTTSSTLVGYQLLKIEETDRLALWSIFCVSAYVHYTRQPCFMLRCPRYLPSLRFCISRRFFRTLSCTKDEYALTGPANVLHTEDADPDHFFSYTSGRWIHNESHQLSLRYRRFNVNALKEVVARAGGGNIVLKMKKLAEGSHNKVFHCTLDNGRELIARIPTILAGPGHLVTASEVATIDFVRSQLGIPVPRVLAWCSDASSTPVEAEYIVMEKAAGIELGKVWDKMSSDAKDAVVREWVGIESSLLAPISGGYGSVFYRDDIDQTLSRDILVDGTRQDRFVVGPSVSPDFWEGERRDMDIDRGPCESAAFVERPALTFATGKNPLLSLKAESHRERSWIETYAVPDPNPGPFDPPANIQNPMSHLSLLSRYESILPYLRPPALGMLRPTLWHTDLHFGNIFISPEDLANEKVTITAIIDWQHTSLRPLYLQARTPRFIRYHAPVAHSHNPKDTSLPDNFEQVDASEQQETALGVELADRHKLYAVTCASRSPDYHRAFFFDTKDLIIPPTQFAGRTWSGGFVPLRHCLIQIVDHWDLLGHVGVACPIEFSASERVTHAVDASEWQEAEDGRELMQERIGVEEDGWVSVEEYDDAVARNEELKKEFIGSMPPGEDRDNFLRVWPYRDVA